MTRRPSTSAGNQGTPDPTPRRGSGTTLAVSFGLLALLALATVVTLSGRAGDPGPTMPTQVTPALYPAGVAPAGRPSPGPAASSVLHPVRIRQPVKAPRVDTGLRDAHGEPVTTACASCHATSRPRAATRSAVELDEFHQGLTYAHGELTCLSCHHAGNYDRLRLADGRELEFPDTMQLCAQCHGPQYRDYRQGSHGGMTGHWDLRRGPRERNHCVDCHDPHAPAYPLVRPVFAPAPDRGLAATASTSPANE